MTGEGAGAGAIHGWGCTPTGDPPPEAVSTDDDSKPSCLPAKLHNGWRRTALYGILIFLMVLIFLNIALTLWIISALKLSMSGIGPIKIVKGGIELAGQAWFLDSMVASTIASPTAQPLTLHSHRNFTVLVSEPGSPEYAKLVMKRDSVQCSGRELVVSDARGAELFSARRGRVRVGADALTAGGAGGVLVKAAVQTPVVRAPHGSDLLLESLTRRLDLRASQTMHFESRAGSIEVTSHSNISLHSTVAAIKIDAPNIIINNLKVANVTTKPAKNVKGQKVYQLCACATGKLFLAPPDALCEVPSTDSDLCR